MHIPERTIWFVGDLDDPWVAAIARALPATTTLVPAAGEWPEARLRELPTDAVLVLHRPSCSAWEAERMATLRKARGPSLRILLCAGAFARYADLERWVPWVDTILPEATAAETIGRHVAWEGWSPVRLPAGKGPRLAVLSANVELRTTLAEGCAATGYEVETARGWDEPIAAGVPVVWDVPVLEPNWSRELACHSRRHPIVSLVGFADRSLVREARGRGASACLELPCDPADLLFVLERLAARRGEPPHDVPPEPASRRRRRRPSAEIGRGPQAAS